MDSEVAISAEPVPSATLSMFTVTVPAERGLDDVLKRPSIVILPSLGFVSLYLGYPYRVSTVLNRGQRHLCLAHSSFNGDYLIVYDGQAIITIFYYHTTTNFGCYLTRCLVIGTCRLGWTPIMRNCKADLAVPE